MNLLKIFLKYPALVLLIIAIPALLPLLRPGFFSVHDEGQHILDIYQMFRAFQIQSFPPRWAPDLTFGLGYPYFNFYYLMPFYIGAFFMNLGLSITASFKGVMLVSVLSAIFGFYLFAKKYVSTQAAMVAAALYLYTPYFAVDLYVRGALGELVIFGVFPWVMYFLNKVINTPSGLNIFFAALAIAVMGITHNVLNIFIFPIFFGFGVLISITKKNVKQNLGVLLLCLFFGALLSSYYWLPALFERKFISSYEQFNIYDQFPFLKQLLIPSWGYGVSIWGPLDGLSFQIGTVNLVFILLSLATLKLSKLKKPTLFFLGLFFIMFVLMNSRSYNFFWNLNPILHFIQFPWRLLIFTTVASASLAAFVMEVILNRLQESKKIIFTFLTIIVIILANAWYFHPSNYSNISDEEYLGRYFANRTLTGNGQRPFSKEYLNFSEDFLPPTLWQKIRSKELPQTLLESSSSAKITLLENNLDVKALIEATAPAKIVLNKTYFPGWQAYIKDNKINTYPVGKLGVIGFDVPAGNNQILIKFENTFIRKLANLASLAAFLVLLIIMLYPVRLKKHHD